jgi:hypothetical protein
MKLTKKLAAVGAAVMIMGTMTVIGASAYNVSGDGYGSFEWSTSSATTTNESTTARTVESFMKVYKDKTGVYVYGDSDSNSGGYGTKAVAKSNGYSSSSYNFKCWGNIYHSSTQSSGVGWTSGVKSLD